MLAALAFRDAGGVVLRGLLMMRVGDASVSTYQEQRRQG
jgi:hypothetical protein